MAKCKPKSCAPRHTVAWSVLSTKLCLLPMSLEEPQDRRRGCQIRAWVWVRGCWPGGLLLSSEPAVLRSLRQVAATRLIGTQAGIPPSFPCSQLPAPMDPRDISRGVKTSWVGRWQVALQLLLLSEERSWRRDPFFA